MNEDLPSGNANSDSRDDSSQCPDPEEDLDSLLAEASALANEVSEELGRTDELPEALTGPNAIANLEPPEPDVSSDLKRDMSVSQDDIDSQLAQVDDLLSDTAAQIGSEKDASHEKTESESGDSVLKSNTRAVPSSDQSDSNPADAIDDESSQAGSGTEGPHSAGESKAESQPAGDPGFAKLGVVSSKTVDPDGLLATSDAQSMGERDGPSPAETRAEMDAKKRVEATSDTDSSTGARLFGAAIAAGEQCVNILERFDSRMRWLGDRPRRAIGWAALATLGTSLFALICSFF